MALIIFIVNTIKASRKWTVKDLALRFMYEKSSRKTAAQKRLGEDEIVELEG